MKLLAAAVFWLGSAILLFFSISEAPTFEWKVFGAYLAAVEVVGSAAFFVGWTRKEKP